MRGLVNLVRNVKPEKILGDNLHIAPLVQSELEDALKIVTDTYTKKNSISRALNIPYDKFCEFVRIGFQRSIDEKLAFVCKDYESKIIGAAMFWDQFNKMKNPISYETFEKGSKMSQQSDILGNFLAKKKLSPSKPYDTIYCSYLVSDPSYSTYEISKQLMGHFVEGTPVGMKASLVYRESVSPKSDKLLRKLGWKVIDQMSLKKYLGKYQGGEAVKLAEEMEVDCPDNISLLGYQRKV